MIVLITAYRNKGGLPGVKKGKLGRSGGGDRKGFEQEKEEGVRRIPKNGKRASLRPIEIMGGLAESSRWRRRGGQRTIKGERRSGG